MAINEMDARLISQAAQISELSATDLVSVSRGEGQPSLNIQFGDLVKAVASVLGNNENLVGVEKYYKRKGSALSDDELNQLFDGGDVYVGSSINDSNHYFLVQSYRYGRASCLQYAIDVNDASFKKYVRAISSGGTWGQWKYVDNFGANTKSELASMVAGLNTKTLEFAINDTSSTSSYYIKVEGYNEVFDHTCYGGGICIVSSKNSKTQILYTDWGVKYRLFRNGAWIDWIQITTA